MRLARRRRRNGAGAVLAVGGGSIAGALLVGFGTTAALNSAGAPTNDVGTKPVLEFVALIGGGAVGAMLAHWAVS